MRQFSTGSIFAEHESVAWGAFPYPTGHSLSERQLRGPHWFCSGVSGVSLCIRGCMLLEPPI
jgi:hypothetical protein